jgi:hypothetical protein
MDACVRERQKGDGFASEAARTRINGEAQQSVELLSEKAQQLIQPETE